MNDTTLDPQAARALRKLRLAGRQGLPANSSHDTLTGLGTLREQGLARWDDSRRRWLAVDQPTDLDARRRRGKVDPDQPQALALDPEFAANKATHDAAWDQLEAQREAQQRSAGVAVADAERRAAMRAWLARCTPRPSPAQLVVAGALVDGGLDLEAGAMVMSPGQARPDMLVSDSMTRAWLIDPDGIVSTDNGQTDQAPWRRPRTA